MVDICLKTAIYLFYSLNFLILNLRSHTNKFEFYIHIRLALFTPRSIVEITLMLSSFIFY